MDLKNLPMHLVDAEEGLVLEVAAPGLKGRELRVFLTDQDVRLAANPDVVGGDENYTVGDFIRPTGEYSAALPRRIDVDKTVAVFYQGILSVVMPFASEDAPFGKENNIRIEEASLPGDIHLPINVKPKKK